MSPMSGSGRNYWRRLQELADSPEFAEIVEREIPRFRAALDGLDRRRFLQIMAAPMVLAALSGCGQEADPQADRALCRAAPRPRAVGGAVLHDRVYQRRLCR